MELRRLEQFIAVAEEMSFTRASARLHLVQSALSVSIQALERDVGARLFDRKRHGVELTDAGAALLPEARRTLAAAEAARDAVAAVTGGVRGSVRIGIMHSLSLIDLAGLLTEFHRVRPAVQLVPRAAQGGSAELVNEVLEGRLDVAFVALPEAYPAGLTVHSLASEQMVLVRPAAEAPRTSGAVPLRELQGLRFVDFPEGWGVRIATDRLFRAHGVHREVAVEVADIPNVLDLVGAGFGSAFLGRSMVRRTKRLAIHRVEPCPIFTVSLVTAATLPPSAATRAFVQLVTDRYPAVGKAAE